MDPILQKTPGNGNRVTPTTQETSHSQLPISVTATATSPHLESITTAAAAAAKHQPTTEDAPESCLQKPFPIPKTPRLV